MRIRFLLWLLIPFFMGCKEYREVQVTGVKGFNLNKINAQGIDGDILLNVKNPNPYGFSLFKSDFDVTYSGVYLGKASLGKRVKIKAGEERTYAVNIRNDFKDVSLTDIMKLLSGGSFKNEIAVKGNLRVGKLFISKKIPVDFRDRIRLN